MDKTNLADIRIQSEKEREAAIQKEYNRFVTGERLLQLTQLSAEHNSRDAYGKLCEWIDKRNFAHDGHIGTLFGLRRTGKTVIMHQLAHRYYKKGIKVAYATYRYKEAEFNSIIPAVQRLVDEGYSLILLDEITRTEGFYNGSMTLSDLLTAKIVVAGTESLMLYWSMCDPLFGRTVSGRTTSMRYEEYKRIFPDRGIENFMRDGGVLWENEPETVSDYLRTSVVENIKNSVNLLESWDSHTDKETLGEIDGDTLLRLLVAVCEKGTEGNVRSHMESYRDEGVAWKLTQAHMHEGESKKDIRLKAIKDGLQEYYAQIPEDGYDTTLVDTLIKRLKNLNFLEVINESRSGLGGVDILTITQPYIKRDFIRRTLSIMPEYSDLLLGSTVERMEAIADGIILEDTVYFEARHRYFDRNTITDNVFKLKDGSKEIDVCVFHEKTKHLSLIEVKFSDKKVKTGVDAPTGQDRWLIDVDLVTELERFFNPNKTTRTVLYRGITDEHPDENGVRWVNVEEWLLGEIHV